MRATLIYNANAGSSDRARLEDLEAILREEGYDPVCQATADERELGAVLADIRGLVIAAGGDGTVRAVASQLLDKEDVAFSFLPMGTANNIARSFQLEHSPEEALRGLSNRRTCPLDVGRVCGPWGESFFLEGAGLGLYADLLADYDPDEGKSVVRAAGTVGEVLLDYQPRAFELRLDGRDLSGRYVALEVLNTKAVGPRLRLAPDADPCDGAFDVVCLHVPEGVSLLDYAKHLLTDSFDELPNVETLSGRNLEFDWEGAPLHIDAEIHTREMREAARVKVDILPGALELWLPPAAG